MYARFSIDTSPFEIPDIPYGSEEHHAFVHFLQFWKEYGILVSRDLMHVSARLPDDLKHMFLSVAKRMKFVSNRTIFTNLTAQEMLGHIMDNDAAVLQTLRLDLLGVTSADYRVVNRNAAQYSFRPHGREEICSIINLLITNTVERLKLMRAEDISEETPPAEVWTRKFYPFLLANNSVHIVDRYAFTNFARTRSESDDGFAFLIRSLAATNGERGVVEILTTATDLKREDVLKGFDKLERYCANVGVEKLTLCIATDAEIQKVFHDRFVMGADHSIDLGNGLDAFFAREPRKKPISFSLKSITNARISQLYNLRNMRRGMKEYKY